MLRNFVTTLVFLIYWVKIITALPSSRLDNSCNCVCGVRGRSNRIVGGKVSAPHEQPWLAGLWRQGKMYCGATVISQKFLVTAAHCVYSFDAKDIRVYLGGHEITKDFTEVRRIKKVHHHEHFNVVSFEHDIALLELEKPILFGPKVQPICLPDNRDDFNYTGVLAAVSGWGRTAEKEKISKVLRSVTVPIWSDVECKDAGYGRDKIKENMMCAGYHDGGKDACQGDSGGSAVIEGPTGSMEIIGVVSWGRGCARPNLPGIYTKIISYLPWVHKLISDECLCKPKYSPEPNLIFSDYYRYY